MAEDAERLRRRVLRLGALLFRLGYYMSEHQDVAGHIYRRDATTYVQVVDGRVLLVQHGVQEWLSLETAITRCKQALEGTRSLHEG